MASWNGILDEVRTAGSTYDIIRRKYLQELQKVTRRNVILYYSGWLQKVEMMRQGIQGFSVNDSDKNGFMAAIHGLDRDKGLDLVLHTPGGETAATESLVDYLRAMFGTDIRALIPQLAMSAGTMMACAAKSIVMGKPSSLGPIDPQIGGMAAHGVIEEWKRAWEEIRAEPQKAVVWQPIIAKYSPTLIGECDKSIRWSTDMAKEWLVSGMFAGDEDANAKADKVVSELGDHALTYSHARHLPLKRAQEIGLVVESLEDNQDLQDALLTVHHACIQTLASTPAVKIIENHEGVAFIATVGTVLISQGQ